MFQTVPDEERAIASGPSNHRAGWENGRAQKADRIGPKRMRAVTPRAQPRDASIPSAPRSSHDRPGREDTGGRLEEHPVGCKGPPRDGEGIKGS